MLVRKITLHNVSARLNFSLESKETAIISERPAVDSRQAFFMGDRQ